MPPPERFDLLQDVVYWEQTSVSGYADPVVAAPVGLKGRLVATRGDRLDANGNRIGYEATLAVDRKLKEGSLVWEGKVADLTGTGPTPTPDGFVYQISKDTTTPDVKARIRRYSYGLVRFKQSITEVVG